MILFKDLKLTAEMSKAQIEEKLSEDETAYLDFIQRCLEMDPEKRISADEALRHHWFRPLLAK